MVLGHLGNWELLAQVSPELFKCPCGAIYQTLRNPFIDREIRDRRSREGLRLFARKEGFFSAIELARAGGSVGVLCDQHAGDGGVWVPLFGRLASTSPLPAAMAMRTDGLILAASMYTDGVGRWRFVIQDPVEPCSRDSAEVTAQVNRILESQIRVSPADWLWAHNRWKTPDPKFLLGSSKRGFFTEGLTQKFRLVIRSTNWLGDAVMTIPAVRAMKRSRPDLELTVLTPAKLAGLWRAVPEVDVVLPLAEGGIVDVANQLRKGNYDVIVLFPNSLRVGLEAWLSGIPRRVGYPGHTRRWLINQVMRVSPPAQKAPEHQVHHYLRLAEFVGASPLPESEWTLPPKIYEGGLDGRVLKFAVCPGAEYGPAKRWFPERFAAVMTTLSACYSCEWNLVGVPKDEAIGREIEAGFQGGGLHNWIGKTSLEGLINLLRGCDLLLTNDTGTMHLAAMLGVPVVAVFGSTEPVLTGPLGLGHTVVQHRVPCGPCFQRECHVDFSCMKQVSVGEVVAAIELKLNTLFAEEKGSA